MPSLKMCQRPLSLRRDRQAQAVFFFKHQRRQVRNNSSAWLLYALFDHPYRRVQQICITAKFIDRKSANAFTLFRLQ